MFRTDGNVSQEYLEERLRNSPLHLLRKACTKPVQNSQKEDERTNRETNK